MPTMMRTNNTADGDLTMSDDADVRVSSLPSSATTNSNSTSKNNNIVTEDRNNPKKKKDEHHPQQQQQPSNSNSEELPPRILLFSPSPDKVSTPSSSQQQPQQQQKPQQQQQQQHHNHYQQHHDDHLPPPTPAKSSSNNNSNNNPPASTSSPSSGGMIPMSGGGHVISSSVRGGPNKSSMPSSTSGGGTKMNDPHANNNIESSSPHYSQSRRSDRDSYGAVAGTGGPPSYHPDSRGGGGRPRYGGGGGYDEYPHGGHHSEHPRPEVGDYPANNQSSGGGAPPSQPPHVKNNSNSGASGSSSSSSYPVNGMQAARLAYENDRNNSHVPPTQHQSSSHHHMNSHHPHSQQQPQQPPPTQPPTPSSAYHSRYGTSGGGGGDAMRRKDDIMTKNYHNPPPQASPTSSYDRYGGGYRNNTRYEMDHHRRSLMDMGGSAGGDNPRNNNGAGGMDDIDGGGRGFDGRTGGSSGGGGYHVSPAVAISRRGGSKRSYDHTSEHLFPNNNERHNSHASPPNVRNTSAVRYCTPIVTGSERTRGGGGLDNMNFPQGSAATGGQDEHNLHHHAGGPSPQPPRYNEDPYDSHMRHYHRPYPSIRGGTASSPPRYGDSSSPQQQHHRGGANVNSARGGSPPPHYATPVLPRGGSSSTSVRGGGDRNFYDPSHGGGHSSMSYHHRNDKDYGVGYGYNHGSSGYYSPYDRHLDHGDYRNGNHPSHRSNNPIKGDMGGMPPQHPHHGHHYPPSHHHHHPPPPTATLNTKPPPQKKQRRSNNSDPDKKSRAAAKPPRRKKMYSDYVGVTYNKTHAKFQACITHYRKQHYLGRYKLSVDAARAYDKSAKELKGDGWKINFQNDAEFEKARNKEIDDNEKKKLAAAQLAKEQEALKLLSLPTPTTIGNSIISSVKQEAIVKPSSTVASTIVSSATMEINIMNNDKNNEVHKAKVENDADSGKIVKTEPISEESSQVKETIVPTTNTTDEARTVSSSAVTPSPNTQNLNKLNLMNEPLLSPLPTKSSSGRGTFSASSHKDDTMTPALRKSVFSPIPTPTSAISTFNVNASVNATTPNITTRDDKINANLASTNTSRDLSVLKNNIFPSPLEKSSPKSLSPSTSFAVDATEKEMMTSSPTKLLIPKGTTMTATTPDGSLTKNDEDDVKEELKSRSSPSRSPTQKEVVVEKNSIEVGMKEGASIMETGDATDLLTSPTSATNNQQEEGREQKDADAVDALLMIRK